MSITVRRLATLRALADEAAMRFSAAAALAAAAHGRFRVVLPGGRTPVVLYRALRKAPWIHVVPWEKCDIFFSDERCVPEDDPASNYGLAQRELFAYVPLPATQVYRAPVGEGPASDVAAAWERLLRKAFDAGATYPDFDLAILGVGPDGHTASLFPGNAALDAEGRWVMPVAACGTPPVARVTLTLPVLNHARTAMFLAAGRDKRGVIDIITTDRAAARATYPSARVEPRGGALWLFSEQDLTWPQNGDPDSPEPHHIPAG
jgi:6-phosphogluconolactonase